MRIDEDAVVHLLRESGVDCADLISIERPRIDRVRTFGGPDEYTSTAVYWDSTGHQKSHFIRILTGTPMARAFGLK